MASIGNPVKPKHMERLGLYLGARDIKVDWNNNDQRMILRAMLCNLAMQDSFVSLQTFSGEAVAWHTEANSDMMDILENTLRAVINQAESYKGRHITQNLADMYTHRNVCTGCQEYEKPTFTPTPDVTPESDTTDKTD